MKSNPPPSRTDQAKGCLLLLCLAAAGLGWCSYQSPADRAATTARETAETLKQAERRRLGFHCLSSWDGAHRQFVDDLRPTLVDPASFQHVETRISPLTPQGDHLLVMDYRARDAIGLLRPGRATAVVRGKDCRATRTS